MVAEHPARLRDRFAVAFFAIRRHTDPEDTEEDPCCPAYPNCELCWFCSGWPMRLGWPWLYRWHIRRVERRDFAPRKEDPMPG